MYEFTDLSKDWKLARSLILQKEETMKKQTVFSKLITLSCLFILLLLPGLTASASGMPAQPQQERPTDPAELEAFLDEFFAEQMEALHIPSVVIVFVKDGEIFLAKGYGLTDVENGAPVDPEQTVFRAGSVSKLFNATPAYFVALLVIPLLTAVLIIGLLVFTVWAWKENYWSNFGRVHYTLITLAALAFTWFINYWNLLGWRL